MLPLYVDLVFAPYWCIFQIMCFYSWVFSSFEVVGELVTSWFLSEIAEQLVSWIVLDIGRIWVGSLKEAIEKVKIYWYHWGASQGRNR